MGSTMDFLPPVLLPQTCCPKEAPLLSIFHLQSPPRTTIPRIPQKSSSKGKRITPGSLKLINLPWFRSPSLSPSQATSFHTSLEGVQLLKFPPPLLINGIVRSADQGLTRRPVPFLFWGGLCLPACPSRSFAFYSPNGAAVHFCPQVAPLRTGFRLSPNIRKRHMTAAHQWAEGGVAEGGPLERHPASSLEDSVLSPPPPFFFFFLGRRS